MDGWLEGGGSEIKEGGMIKERQRGSRIGRDGRLVRETNNPDSNSVSLWSPQPMRRDGQTD